MAKNTIYKVAAAVYDIYCKSQNPDQNQYMLSKVMRYHEIGNQLSEAMRLLGLYETENGCVIWKGNPPTFEMIEKINQKRKEITLHTNQLSKIRDENISKELTAAEEKLRKLQLEIEELKKKQPEKRSFIAKLFN
jgi:hypothetical protein